jgi:glutamate-ammonia-ligase adenylyltransferase
VWSTLNEGDSVKTLKKMGYKQATAICQLLLRFKNSRSCEGLKKHARSRLDKMMPVLILMIAKEQDPVYLMKKMLQLMQSIVRRSAYLALLLEKPEALAYLIRIAKESEWILKQICTYPILLDELLSPPLLPEVIDKDNLENELNMRMHWLAETDLEGQMDHLRQFKLACFLHLAIIELLNIQTQIDIPLVLNDVTEIILTKIYDLSLDFMIRHYHLKETADELKQKIPFGIIAYGKVGARELNYASDLDLVFLYGSQDLEYEEKDQKLNHAEFSLRLAQRIIHMLSTHTSAGTLYDVDVRLRPGGSAGLLVSHSDAFGKYLHEHAWTWEHQALVKARLVVGPKTLVCDFEKLRTEILTKDREAAILRNEINLMREKMQSQFIHKKNEFKTIKRCLADIEFIVQYFMLLYSRDNPSLLIQRSTVQILNQLRADHLIDRQVFDKLKRAHMHYQMLIRHKILQPAFDFSEDELFGTYAHDVDDIWRKIFTDR